MLVREYVMVYELLEFVNVCTDSHKCVDRNVFPMTDDAEKQVVRCYAVASCAHRFLPGIVYNRMELV